MGIQVGAAKPLMLPEKTFNYQILQLLTYTYIVSLKISTFIEKNYRVIAKRDSRAVSGSFNGWWSYMNCCEQLSGMFVIAPIVCIREGQILTNSCKL